MEILASADIRYPYILYHFTRANIDSRSDIIYIHLYMLQLRTFNYIHYILHRMINYLVVHKTGVQTDIILLAERKPILHAN